MKSFTLFIFLITIIFFSCTKKKIVHFHGRVVFECNQEPVRNTGVEIHRYYDASQGEFIIGGKTNYDGYYSMVSEVDETGSFDNYKLFIISSNSTPYLKNLGAFESHNNSNNVQIDGLYQPAQAYSFHIKNVSPFNSNDIFSGLKVFLTPHDQLSIIAPNLYGTGIDTTIVYFLDYPILFYSYSFTKNGILTSSPLDSTSAANCLDTSRVDIYY